MSIEARITSGLPPGDEDDITPIRGSLLSGLESLLQSEVPEMAKEVLSKMREQRTALQGASIEVRGARKLALWAGLLKSRASEANLTFQPSEFPDLGEEGKDAARAQTDAGVAIRKILRYAQKHHPEALTGAQSVEEALDRLSEILNR